ncbi:MAG: phosphoribosyltransferase [Gammaproteobacteria bacterium]|nr:phosphoribosyltransferase [Gammaproteobacteria bacterium]MDH3561488.1 phosphoribosyltransferase [Gammaproteobacteria bacterium]
MPAEELRCELISWQRMYQLASQLAFAILDSGFQPDVIVGIARGGYVPARILCDFLDVYALTSIRVVHYASGARKQPLAEVTDSLCTDITGKRVLIVDDVSDTGDTYEVAIRHLAGFEPLEIRTAVLLHKTTASYRPDYIGRKVIKWRWMIYPWALIEDITGFIEHMDPLPRGPEETARRLQSDYGLILSKTELRTVLRVLELRSPEH